MQYKLSHDGYGGAITALRRCNSCLHNPLGAILAHITASAIWAMAPAMTAMSCWFMAGIADVVGFLFFFSKFLGTGWPIRNNLARNTTVTLS